PSLVVAADLNGYNYNIADAVEYLKKIDENKYIPAKAIFTVHNSRSDFIRRSDLIMRNTNSPCALNRKK
ncbi:9897_t:CDS:1, partial [Scutellospora calospora]